MARKKAARKRAGRTTAPAVKPTTIALKIQVEPSPDTSVYYANYAEIAHSQHDFVLSFVRVPAKSSSVKTAEILKTGVLPLEPVAQITIPPTLARPLIAALERQIETYERTIGPMPEKGNRNGRK